MVKTYPLAGCPGVVHHVCMFLRFTNRKKDGKTHRYWSAVENRRVHGGGSAQKVLLYLREINDSQHAGWCKAIEAIVQSPDAAMDKSFWSAF